MTRPFATVSELFGPWKEDILSDEPPATWSIGDPVFAHVEVAPRRIGLLGGAPGCGKTALFNQWVGGILDSESDARILIANVEMSPEQLLTRMLSCLSRVPLTAIRKHEIPPASYTQIGTAMDHIQKYADRLAFAREPSNLDSVRMAAAAHRADILVLDYLQRINPPGKFGTMRDRINMLMDELRRLADGGAAILVAAALTRSRDGKGRASYAGQNLSIASFRESGEVEYAADNAHLLFPTDEDKRQSVRSMLLKHEKCRDGEPKDVALQFDRRIQKFEHDPFLETASTSRDGSDRGRDAWGAGSGNGAGNSNERAR
jgi:replicative DNA helicase